MRRRTLTLLVALAATTGAFAGLTGNAHAVSNVSTSGKPGSGTYYKAGGWTVPFAQHTLRIEGPTIRRSRASRATQRVYVTRYLYKRIPSTPGEGLNPWRLELKRTTRARIRRGYKRTFGDWDLNAQSYVSYHVRYKVSYYTVRGKFLGRAVVAYDRADDYHCYTGNCASIYARGLGAMTFTY
jgi:hypothetical protein